MIRLLNNSDIDMVMEYLERNHIETTFLIGNVISFGLENNKNIRRCADYIGYFEEETLRGILTFYNLGSCIPHYESKAAIQVFTEIMKERKFSYLLGMEHIVKPLYEEIKEIKELEEYSEDAYYINNNFKPYTLDGIQIIDGKQPPLDDLEAFIKEAYADGFRSVRTREDIEKMFNERSADEDFLFLVKDGEIKAQANVQTYTSKINQVGGVFTLRSERGKGYCKAIVSEVCRRIIQRGKTPTLMVRKNNTPAVKAYESLGFRYYCDYLIIFFKG
jgi:uncharacterized protein